MKTNIFHNASLKLTGTYLVIIMVISLVFSFGLYRISSQEIERGIRRQPGPIGQIINARGNMMIENLVTEQDEAIEESQSRLRVNLLIINLSILIGGGLLSYYLARRTLEPIEKAHEAQSRFAADASHELRTPITAMRAETELALTDSKLTLRNAKEQLESNIEELDKLTSLSNGLLRLARLDNSGLETKAEKISDIINQSVERVKPLAEQKKQLIVVSKISKKLTIEADITSITEAIVTLLDNAVKYSPDKSQIQVQIKDHNKYVEIKIIDKGVGIKASDLPHIFDRFYRADQSRNKTMVSGYGIGLSIAKVTIEAHHGKISVNSTPEKGSTFTISLPKT